MASGDGAPAAPDAFRPSGAPAWEGYGDGDSGERGERGEVDGEVTRWKVGPRDGDLDKERLKERIAAVVS